MWQAPTLAPLVTAFRASLSTLLWTQVRGVLPHRANPFQRHCKGVHIPKSWRWKGYLKAALDMKNRCCHMSRGEKYFIPQPANTSFHLIGTEKRLCSLPLNLKLPGGAEIIPEQAERWHSLVSSPARGPGWGSCSGQSSKASKWGMKTAV